MVLNKNDMGNWCPWAMGLSCNFKITNRALDPGESIESGFISDFNKVVNIQCIYIERPKYIRNVEVAQQMARLQQQRPSVVRLTCHAWQLCTLPTLITNLKRWDSSWLYIYSMCISIRFVDLVCPTIIQTAPQRQKNVPKLSPSCSHASTLILYCSCWKHTPLLLLTLPHDWITTPKWVILH